MQVFYDQFSQDWAQFQRGPVKCIVQLVPALQICATEECPGDCRFFHPAVEETVKSKPGDADVFSVFIRTPASAVRQILAASGLHGIFFEPRQRLAPGQTSQYAVIWLQKQCTIEEAHRYKRTEETVLGLARLGNKLGLRVLSKNEALLLKRVYPDRTVVACNIVQVYEMGPIPHGINKQEQIAQMIRGWPWTARPLKPTRHSANGRYWDIGTSEPPPEPYLTTDHGVLTVALKRKAETLQKPTTFHAAAKTWAHIRSQGVASSSSSSMQQPADPWQGAPDPWAAYRGAQKDKDAQSQPPANPPTNTVHRRIKDIEDKLLEKIDDRVNFRLQAAATNLTEDVDMSEETKLKMQSEIVELQSQNQKFETWFGDMGGRLTNLETHVQQQNQQIQHLNSMTQETSANTMQLRKEVGDLRSDFGTQLQQAFENQSTRLEALLEKRSKHS